MLVGGNVFAVQNRQGVEALVFLRFRLGAMHSDAEAALLQRALRLGHVERDQGRRVLRRAVAKRR